MVDFRNAAFISAHRPRYTAGENSARSSMLAEVMRNFGLTFEPVKGVFNGIAEDSFIVALDWSLDNPPAQVMQCARSFEQDAVLFTIDGEAWMEYTNGTLPERLGFMYWQPHLPFSNIVSYTVLPDGTFLVVK